MVVHIVAALLLILVTYVVYQSGLKGPFLFDDIINIVRNPALHSFSLDTASIKEVALSRGSGVLYRPVSMLSFAGNVSLSGFDTFYFKLTNLIIHLINGLGLYILSYRLLTTYQKKYVISPISQIEISYISLAVCAMWLLHPLNLTTILYVVQRMTGLSALFTIYGLITYMIGRDQIIKNRFIGYIVVLIGVVLFGGLSLLSKENGALFLLYVVLIELIFYKFDSGATTRNRFKPFWVVLIVAPIALTGIIVLSNPDQYLTLSRYKFYDFSLTERILTESRVIWMYLRLIIAPDITLMGLYHDDFILSSSILDPLTTLFSILGIIALIVTVLILFRKLPLVSFGIGWFLVSHFLESTIIPLELVHEHRNYLALFGIELMIGYYLLSSYKKLGSEPYKFYILALFYILLFAHSTYSRSEHWSNTQKLAAWQLKNHPESARANTDFATVLYDHRQYSMATRFFARAANLRPKDPSTVLRLIQSTYIETKAVPDEYIEELNYRFSHSNFRGTYLVTFEPLLIATQPHSNLNLRLSESYEKYIKSAQFIPVNWQAFAYRQLADNYKATGKYNRALEYYKKLLKISTRPWYYLASADIYISIGKNEKAKQMLDALDSPRFVINTTEQQYLTKILNRLGG